MSETPAPAFMRNFDDLPWLPWGVGHFASDDKDLTGGLGARRLDCSLTRLAPGKTSCPYHFHHVGEELFVVLEGHGQLRFNGEIRRVRAHDVVSCPPGPTGAHQFLNDGDAPLVYLAISTVDDHELAEYPDSGKVLAYSRQPDGATARYIFRALDQVGYWAGELSGNDGPPAS